MSRLAAVLVGKVPAVASIEAGSAGAKVAVLKLVVVDPMGCHLVEY